MIDHRSRSCISTPTVQEMYSLGPREDLSDGVIFEFSGFRNESACHQVKVI